MEFRLKQYHYRAWATDLKTKKVYKLKKLNEKFSVDVECRAEGVEEWDELGTLEMTEAEWMAFSDRLHNGQFSIAKVEMLPPYIEPEPPDREDQLSEEG